jgi:NitT/TauT family transport system substrate-binding protein
MRRTGRGWLAAIAGLLIVCGSALPARAETIRIAAQYGISYLPLTIIEAQHLLETLGRQQKLDVTTKWLKFTDGAAMNEALISGQLDIVSGGVAPMVLLWARTRNNLHVRGIAALDAMPLYLNTIDADVRSIKDFTSQDRIAMPAAGVSIQAITLMMAAAQVFGPANAQKLNPLMVSMSHPDGMAAMLARKAGITAHFTSAPFMYEELGKPGVHRLLDSYTVLGGPATFNVVWTTGRFARNNPKVIQVFTAALRQADSFIAAHPEEAVKIYMASEPTSLTEAALVQMIKDPENHWTIVPQRTMQYADFMAKIGMIPAVPASWKDLFFPVIDDESGS